MSFDYLYSNDSLDTYCRSNNFKRCVGQAVICHLNCMLPRMMEERYLYHFVDKISSQITEEISRQIPLYLKNNYQMQQILDTHTFSLKKQLDGTVKEILDKISNDPKYQEVINSHLAVIKHNSEKKLDEITSNANAQSVSIQTFFDQQLKQLETQFNQNFSDLSVYLSKFSTLEKEVLEQKKRQKNDTNRLLWIITGTVVTASIITFSMTRWFK